MSFVKKAVHAVVHAVEHPFQTIKKVATTVFKGVKKAVKVVAHVGKALVMGVVHDAEKAGKGLLKYWKTIGHTIKTVGSDVIHGHIGDAFKDGGKGLVNTVKAGGNAFVDEGKLALDCPIIPGVGEIGMVKNGAEAVATTVKTVAGTSKAADMGAKATKATITTGADIGGNTAASEALNKISPDKPAAPKTADPAAPDKPATPTDAQPTYDNSQKEYESKPPADDELPAYENLPGGAPSYDPKENPFLAGDMTPGNAKSEYSYDPIKTPGGYTPESPEITSNLNLPGSDRIPSLAPPWSAPAPATTPMKTFADTPYTPQQPIDFNPLVR